MARCAAVAAFAFQTACLWFRLLFEVFFFGTAIEAGTLPNAHDPLSRVRSSNRYAYVIAGEV